MIVIVMGVSGSGKTTIGQMLSESLGWDFHDADDLHPEANKQKMRSGIALTDEDRAPWLLAIRNLILSIIAAGKNAVIACSALKQGYRDEIVVDPAAVKIVYLSGSPDLIAARISHRFGHFMNPALLQSQFDTLEPPRDAITVDVAATPAEILRAIRAKL